MRARRATGDNGVYSPSMGVRRRRVAKRGDGVAPKATSWQETDVRELLNESALSIGAGSPTDAGRFWRMPTEHPDPIVLAGGIPDGPTLPVEDIREALVRVLDDDPQEALQYGGWLGFEGLREAIAQRQSRIEGLELGPDNYIIHNGSSGSIDNVCRAFVEPGDTVIVEGPSFSGTVRAIRGSRADVVEAPLDRQGIDLGAVDRIISDASAKGRRVKLLYTIADYQNPTGVNMSPARRSALVELCARHRVLVLEDAAYTETYYGDAPPRSLYATAGGQGVLRLGSLSKNIATGLRIGWVQGRPDFVEALARVRFDMGNSPLLLRALAHYLSSGKVDRHIDALRPLYARKADVLCRSLGEHCGPYVRFEKPEGGFFLWVECVGATAGEVAAAAAGEGVVFALGSGFFKDGTSSDTSHVRMAFSNVPVEKLAEVGPRLRKAFLRIVD